MKLIFFTLIYSFSASAGLFESEDDAELNVYAQNKEINKQINYCIDKKVTDGWSGSDAEHHCDRNQGN